MSNSKYWDILCKCPVCKAKLDRKNATYTLADYYDNGKHMANRAGWNVAVCKDCASKVEADVLDIQLDKYSNLIIKDGESTRTLVSSDPYMPEVKCACCGKEPKDLKEYTIRAQVESDYFDSPLDVVVRDDGTYNRFTGAFYCTSCYIKNGRPSGKCKKVFKGE